MFDTTPELWMQLQLQYDLNAAKVRGSGRVNQEVAPLIVQ
jgi:plasmid maintenance system antidote protein VapI